MELFPLHGIPIRTIFSWFSKTKGFIFSIKTDKFVSEYKYIIIFVKEM